MTRDFDAALKAADDWAKELVECSFPSEIQMANYIEAILFALKFTKAALSGEVSVGVQDTYYTTHDNAGTTGWGRPLEAKPSDIFKAMCAELSKEVGNG